MNSEDKKYFLEVMRPQLNSASLLLQDCKKAVGKKDYHNAIFLLRAALSLEPANKKVLARFADIINKAYQKKVSEEISLRIFFLKTKQTLTVLIYFNLDSMFFAKLSGDSFVVPSQVLHSSDTDPGENTYECIGIKFKDDSVIFAVPIEEGLIYIPISYQDASGGGKIIRLEKDIQLFDGNGNEIEPTITTGKLFFDLRKYLVFKNPIERKITSLDLFDIPFEACNF